MASSERSEVFQCVLPSFQGPLGINPDLTAIPASHVENLTVTERLFTMSDIKRVVVTLGVSTPETVEKDIMAYQRRTFSWSSDAVAGVMMILEGVIIDHSGDLAKRFEEEFGSPFSRKALFKKALGGVDIDPREVNLVRDEDDLQLDQQRLAEMRRESELSERAYID